MDVISCGPGCGAELKVSHTDITWDDAAYLATRPASDDHPVLGLHNQEEINEITLAFLSRLVPPKVTKSGSQGTGLHFVIDRLRQHKGDTVGQTRHHAAWAAEKPRAVPQQHKRMA